MWSRALVKQEGLRNFKANYWLCVAVALILSLCDGGGSISSRFGDSSSNTYYYNDSSAVQNFIEAITGSIIALIVVAIVIAVAILVLNPLQVGCRRFFLVNQLQPAQIDNVAFGFKSDYKNVVTVKFMTDLFIFLWTLLLIIPGIIKLYEYRMVDYILCENPSMHYKEAQQRSKDMMYGHKMDAFIFDLSFIGWYILGAITCGLALVFYVSPYKASSDAALYVAIRNCSDVMRNSGSAPEQTTPGYADEQVRDVEFDVEK